MAACSSSAATSILSLHSCDHQPSHSSSSFLSRPSISFRPFHINLSRKTTSPSQNPSFSPSFSVNCLFYGFDAADSAGGDAEGFEREDFVSTQKVRKREFSALGNVLKQIELLDMGAIGESVSGSVKEAMKWTISTMLGLLPSDQFEVTVTVSREPLERILRSSIVTGYTLWNAEYRVSLIRNFSISHDVEESLSQGTESLETLPSASGSRSVLYSNHERMDKEEEEIPKFFADLPAEALNYIKELESKLAVVEKELAVQKQECNELDGGETNDLLNYLRSLEPEMVMELSSPSSPEVDEIIQQLVDNSLQKVFEVQTQRKAGSRMRADPYLTEEALRTSRDYLAKLLFWCMLLGHHMRGLEYRLHMSCVVGLL